MKRLASVMALTAVAVAAMALSSYTKVFEDTYKVKAGSTLKKAMCTVCHTGKMGGKLNAYGADVQIALKGQTGVKLTAEILKKVEGLDSDKDGKTNLEEIKADTHPGIK